MAQDQWGNEVGSDQAGTDAFWNEVVNKKRTTFDPSELSAWGVTQLSPDKYRLNTGQTVDTIRDFGGPNQLAGQWTISGGQQGQNGQGVDWARDPSGQTMIDQSGGGGSSAVGSSFETQTSGQDQALRQLLIDQLTGRAKQSLAVTTNDPTIRAQADPYAANVEREKRNYLADLAEKGGPLVNMTAETRLANEHAGQATGLFESQLIGRELDSRRSEIQDALTQLRGMLTTDQTLALQQQLAQIDDATKRLGLQYQNEQAGNQLGLNYDIFDWNRSPLNPANQLQ